MALLDPIRKRLQDFDSVEFGTGADAALVAQAQQRLAISLPDSYLAYLREYGWLSVKHLELNGLGPGTPEGHNLVALAEGDRHEVEPAMPPFLGPLMNDGCGNSYCLDTRKIRDGECPVVFWDHASEFGERQEPEIGASCFVEWLLGELDALAEMD